ncbi:MAG: ATP-binding protein [Promethearchaeota archaeon]
MPALGKVLSSIFRQLELLILESVRILERKFKIQIYFSLTNKILKRKWGGKIIPLGKNLNPETYFLPSQKIISLLSRSNVVGISKCYCRETQHKYLERSNFDNPIETCIHISFGKSLKEIPYKSENLRKVSKDEIITLLEECEERGLIHQIIFFPNPNFYYVICNCCPCCCVVLKKFLEMGAPPVVKSDFISLTDLNSCNNCGICTNWCYFKARVIKEDKLYFESDRCFGCGLCVSKCPKNAISLVSK